MLTVHGACVDFCSWRGYGVPTQGIWPATARSGALRRWNEIHPRGWCQEPAVAVLSVIEQYGLLDWEAALCSEHLAMYEHLNGHIHKEPKMPPRTIHIYPLEGYLDLVKPKQPSQRQPRQWRREG